MPSLEDVPSITPSASAAESQGVTIEERCFIAALVCLDSHYRGEPPMGPLTSAKVGTMIQRTMVRTHDMKDVRESISRNVAIWLLICRTFAAAIPHLGARSAGLEEQRLTPQESTALILKNYTSLKEDLKLINQLMHITRNMLVTAEPEVAQDLYAAVQLDHMVFELISLCTDMAGKAYEGELDDSSRQKLNDIADAFKTLLVTTLQQVHNWTRKNERIRMSFWYDILFDDRREDSNGDSSSSSSSTSQVEFRRDVAKLQIEHYIQRNSKMCDKARALMRDYYKSQQQNPKWPGMPAIFSPRGHNWIPDALDPDEDSSTATPQWDEDITDKYEQDRLYGRVSREVDTWWLKARDINYDEWVVPMPTVEFAQQRTDSCKATMLKCPLSCRSADHDGSSTSTGGAPVGDAANEDPNDCGADGMMHDDGYDYSDSYGEGPMSGLLTEVPNILSPEQIEPLQMIVKGCILDEDGFGLTRAGENLQETRCRLLLATDSGKALLRELLVFVALWQKDNSSVVFTLTAQIMEAVHRSALVPYAWMALRIPKDIISPAQGVLLSLVSKMFRATSGNPPPADSREHQRDVKLLHYLFIQFRSRVVPECVALMDLQAQIRNNKVDSAEFPIDNWDMERTWDGLTNYLEFLATATELPIIQGYLVQWEAAYELVTLLKALEAAVPKKPLVELPSRSANRKPASSVPSAGHSDDGLDQDLAGDHLQPPPPPPPLQDPPHKFPWADIKSHILRTLAGLLQPSVGKNSPGNAEVQKQIMRHNGIVPLLNCCVYDDHNRFARERVQLCLKWLMDGSDAANDFLRELVLKAPNPEYNQGSQQNPGTTPAFPGTATSPFSPPAAGPAVPAGTSPASASKAPVLPQAPNTTRLRIDGISGEVVVERRARSLSASEAANHGNLVLRPPNKLATTSNDSTLNGSAKGKEKDTMGPEASRQTNPMTLPPLRPGPASSRPKTGRSENLLRDIISLADEATRLAKDAVKNAGDLARDEGGAALAQDADETEEEDFM